MCGIVGLMSDEGMGGNFKGRKGFLRQALITDTLRGDHSTGIASLRRDVKWAQGGEDVLLKKAVPGHDFVELRAYERFEKDLDLHRFVVGHNRLATKGAINSINAHPFHHGDITLVHNGSLWTHRWLTTEQMDVDSEAICKAFSEKDPRTVIPRLDGAFALVWIDHTTGLMHMVRNEERPLSFATIKNEKTVLYASEQPMLEWLANRNRFTIEKIYNIVPGNIITFGEDTTDVRNWTYEEVKLYTPKFYTGTGSYSSGKAGNSSGGSSKAEKRQKERIEKANKILGSYNLKVGDKVSFVPTHKQIIGGSTCHTHGVMFDDPFLMTVVHALHKDSINMDASYSAEIMSVKEEVIKGETIDVLILKPSTMEKVLNLSDQTGDDESANADEFFRGPDGTYITITEFEEKTKHGCANCSCDVFPSDHEDLEWAGNGLPICLDCQDSLPFNTKH